MKLTKLAEKLTVFNQLILNATFSSDLKTSLYMSEARENLCTANCLASFIYPMEPEKITIDTVFM